MPKKPTKTEVRASVALLEPEAAPRQDRQARRALISSMAGPALDQNPVAVYLARFASKDGRRAQLSALRTFAKLIVDIDDPFKVPWAQMRYQHLIATRTKLAESLAPATVNRILCALRGVCEEALRLNQLDPGEAAKIATVTNVKGSRLPAGRHLEEDVDIEPLLAGVAKLDNLVIACRDRAVIAVLRVTGMRRSELVGINIRDLDWGHAETRKGRDVYLLDGTWEATITGKGDKQRKAYLASAAPEIKTWLKVRGLESGPLFCAVHKTGTLLMRRMDPSSVRLIVQRAGDLAHIKLSPHDFRRTAVGDLLDEGVDISTVQKLVGHASVTTTQRYDRRPERAVKAASTKIQIRGKRPVGPESLTSS